MIRKVAAHFADCGIGFTSRPNVIVPSVLAWLGEPPDSEDPGKLERAQAALMAVRPYIRKISSGSLVDDLATGELCIIIASNGDAMQAQERVRIAANGMQIRYSIPREGAVIWFDVAAIPTDAPHPGNAHRLIDFLMDPAIAAENSNAIHFPNGNAAAQPMTATGADQRRRSSLRRSLAARLIPERAKSEEYVRLRTRMWTRFQDRAVTYRSSALKRAAMAFSFAQRKNGRMRWPLHGMRVASYPSVVQTEPIP